ncbi:MAG: putative membrane protein [Pelotomaculum thermopropionicum]|uniref:Putative membrane protein n=1 Tax=Pelotomaculum thermopropionicum TaxID=110500 RepID=A0A101HRY8_9FIRM|nr:MAG: putative membrane protein [Pelotomaculum thermopropionicum]
MGRFKCLLVLLLFFSAVACGVSAVLAEFNQMIRPAGPVVAFSIRNTEPGVYRMEFLGEEIAAELPVSKVENIIDRAYIFAAGTGNKVLRASWRVIEAAAKKLPPKIYDRVYDAPFPLLQEETVVPGRAVSN